MLDIKRTNIISGIKSDVNYGLTKILDFLELIGKNILVLNKNESDINLFYNNKKYFKNIDEYKSIIFDKGNLFRVNLIVLNLWGESIDTVIGYKKLLDKLNIDYILVSNTYKYENKNENLTVSIIEKENGKYYLKDKLNNDRYSFSSYVIQYKREMKLGKLFDDDNDLNDFI